MNVTCLKTARVALIALSMSATAACNHHVVKDDDMAGPPSTSVDVISEVTGKFVPVTYELAIPEADNIDAKYSAYGNDGTWVEDVSKGTLTDESIDLGRGTAMIGEPRSQAAPANLTGVVIVQKPVYRTETRLFLVNGKLTERQVKTPTGEYEDTAVPAN